MEKVLYIIIQLGVFALAAAVHESAHGWTAEKFGDSTARMQGRITLNPIPHIDPIGTVILPLFLAIMGAPVFGWAKPVPVNTYNLRNPRKAHMYIAAAGPASNFALAIISIILFFILKSFVKAAHNPLTNAAGSEPGFLVSTALYTLMFLYLFIIINVILGVFNLIPISPLDGGWIMEGLLRGEALHNYLKIKPYGFLILLGIIYFGLLKYIFNPIFIFLQKILY